jgi:hypothetical protein
MGSVGSAGPSLRPAPNGKTSQLGRERVCGVKHQATGTFQLDLPGIVVAPSGLFAEFRIAFGRPLGVKRVGDGYRDIRFVRIGSIFPAESQIGFKKRQFVRRHVTARNVLQPGTQAMSFLNRHARIDSLDRSMCVPGTNCEEHPIRVGRTLRVARKLVTGDPKIEAIRAVVQTDGLVGCFRHEIHGDSIGSAALAAIARLAG